MLVRHAIPITCSLHVSPTSSFENFGEIKTALSLIYLLPAPNENKHLFSFKDFLTICCSVLRILVDLRFCCWDAAAPSRSIFSSPSLSSSSCTDCTCKRGTSQAELELRRAWWKDLLQDLEAFLILKEKKKTMKFKLERNCEIRFKGGEGNLQYAGR